jgi:hypothetical protein
MARRKSSDQRNALYEEPSLWGVFIVIGLIVAVITGAVIVLVN